VAAVAFLVVVAWVMGPSLDVRQLSPDANTLYTLIIPTYFVGLGLLGCRKESWETEAGGGDCLEDYIDVRSPSALFSSASPAFINRRWWESAPLHRHLSKGIWSG